MLNLKLRFDGSTHTPDYNDQPWARTPKMETLEVSISGTQRMAVRQALAMFGPHHEETVRERNMRLRYVAEDFGRAFAAEICRQLREMGHAV